MHTKNARCKPALGVSVAAGGKAACRTAMTNDYKNALPHEVDDHPDSGMPRQLRTHTESQRDLTPQEADVAGASPAGQGLYGEDSAQPNAADQRDAHAG